MKGATHGDGIATGAALARDLGNLPANQCTPGFLARTAKKLAQGNAKLTTRVLNEAEMKRLGMRSLLSVSAGTVEPAVTQTMASWRNHLVYEVARTGMTRLLSSSARSQTLRTQSGRLFRKALTGLKDVLGISRVR